MYTFVNNLSQLPALLQLMQQHDTYYLDTEFIRTKTRYPQLGLLQLNVNQQIFIIDPLKLDLTAFWNQLFQAQQIVIHSCAEDVNLITHYAQRYDLNNVFDTQIGLNFLGYGHSVGYQTALDKMLNIQIDKYESRSDWLARPLSDLQLDYAANDVIHLYDLANAIKQELASLGHYERVVQDSQCFVKNLLKHTPMEQLYLDLARPSHTRRELAQIQQLCVWREELSISQNIPISFILKNHDLLMIVQRQPENIRQLEMLLETNSRTRRYTHQILKQLYQLPPAKLWPQRLAYPYSLDSEQQEQINQLIQTQAEQLNINPELLMRKKWISDILYTLTDKKDEQDFNPYLLGWRYDIITQPILKLLYNSKC